MEYKQENTKEARGRMENRKPKFVEFTNARGVIRCIRVDRISSVVIDLEDAGHVEFTNGIASQIDKETAKALMDYLLNRNVSRPIITDTTEIEQ